MLINTLFFCVIYLKFIRLLVIISIGTLHVSMSRKALIWVNFSIYGQITFIKVSNGKFTGNQIKENIQLFLELDHSLFIPLAKKVMLS